MNTPNLSESKSPINKDNGSLLIALLLLLIGIGLCCYLPYKLTEPSTSARFDFTETGQIGDTIAGITAPIVGLISTSLLFLALRAQIIANNIIQKQFGIDKESENLGSLYEYIRDSVNNFRFTCLSDYKPIRKIVDGNSVLVHCPVSCLDLRLDIY